MKSLSKINQSFFRILITSALFILLTNEAKAQSVGITSPVAGSNYNVGDIIAVTATASAPFLGAVNKVVFTLGALNQTDVSSPYTASLNTSTLTAGSYTLTVTNYYTPFLGTQTTISTTLTINIASPTPSTYGNYAFSKEITLNSSSLGITSNLTSFPALLYIQDNALKIAGACTDEVQNPNGTNYDFAFTNPNSAGELNYQVEKYDPVAGSLLVWVQIPALSYATNTPIYFYWGSASPTITHNTAFFANTWASDYKAVFHFNESAYTGSVADGTAGGHSGTTSGMTSANLVTGKIGNAYSFNGSSTSIVSNAVTILGTFTISAWVNLSATAHDQKIMTNQATAGSSTGGYKLGVYSDNTPETESATAIDRTSTPTPAAFATGVWHYVQGVYTGSTLSTYVDGVAYKNLTTSTNPTSVTPLYIGVGEGGNQYYFYGTIDEARVSNVAKTADWIKAEFGDQNNPATFTSVGATTINSTNAAALPGALTYTWTGTTSTNPTVATNWNNTTTGTTNQLPAFDGTATLVIPTGLSNYPLLTADESLYGLTITSGASLSLNGHTLSVACNIYNSSTGQILYGSSNTSQITWNGSLAAQSYTGTNTTNTAQLGSMTVNNSAGGTITITGGPVDIYNLLTISKGNLVVGVSPAALTLKSTATQTANVAAIPAAYTITGTVSAERYFQGGSAIYDNVKKRWLGRNYRIISSPVNTGTKVNTNYVYGLNYIVGATAGLTTTASSLTNAFVTGASDGSTSAGNPSLYLFREDKTPSNTTFTSGNFVGITNITNSTTAGTIGASDGSTYSIPVGNGVLFFFRGPATSYTTRTTAPYIAPANVVLTSTGTLNQGSITVNNWYTPLSANVGYTGSGVGTNAAVRGFNMIGNPYACTIDWNTAFSGTGITRTNVNPTIYVFNPVTNQYDSYITTSSSTGTATGSATNLIASGQGFFVQAASAGPALTFTEAAKYTTSQPTGGNLFMGTPAGQNVVQQQLRLKLAIDTLNYDDIVIGFNSTASVKYNGQEDSKYIPGLNALEGLSSMSDDSVKLSINYLPLPKLTQQVIRLNVDARLSRQYTLQRTQLTAVPLIYEIWLMDKYKKDSLDIRANSTYAFDINLADTASYGSNRFEVVIRQNVALGLHLLDFAATKTLAGAQIIWKTENEQNYTNFTIERSTDNGVTFDVLGGFTSSAQGTYSLLDKIPSATVDQYRLKLEDLNGTVTYSKVVTLIYRNQGNIVANSNISIYPNPTNGIINLAVNQTASLANGPVLQPTGSNQGTNPNSNITYKIKIVNFSGNVIKTDTSTEPGVWKGDVSNFLPGTYIIQVLNNNDKAVVGKGTFVKL